MILTVVSAMLTPLIPLFVLISISMACDVILSFFANRKINKQNEFTKTILAYMIWTAVGVITFTIQNYIHTFPVLTELPLFGIYLTGFATWTLTQLSKHTKILFDFDFKDLIKLLKQK
jgi:hypothetical protein